MDIKEIVDARKNRVDDEQAWNLIREATQLIVAKGKKVIEFDHVTEAQATTILNQIMGPSGNLRAPTLRIGDCFVVGFNEEMYTKFFSE